MDAPLKHGGNHVAQTLMQHDVKYVFTLCGGHISPILTGCNTLGIKVIDVRNEATAVFAADAVSRLSNNIGVATVTAGPGLTNTITAIKNTQMAQVPVLILGGSKIESKISLVDNMLPKVDTILIGGAMAFTFLKVKGKNVGASIVDRNNLKVICLDFDGVVVDSNSIKSMAFIEIFEPYQDKILEIKKFQEENESLSRFIKFEYIAKNILMLEMPEKKVSEWHKMYSDLTIEKVSSCNEVNGALDFINYFKKLMPIYLVSATPLDDLNIIINKRGYSDLFKKIYGSPQKKQDALKEIINDEHINHADIIFIGDSQSDLTAANDINICFYGFNSGRKFENFASYNNFEALKQKINEDYYFH